MRKIVPFKKELLFKTKASEITSISIEHQIKQKEDDIISGEFLISGEYKMTEGSIKKEKYNFILPFDIAVNSNYDIDTAKIDIDNFYYEIVNNEILKVNIDILLETVEKEIRIEKENKIEIKQDEFTTKEQKLKQEKNERINSLEVPSVSKENIEINNINNNENINTNINVFENIDNNETYSTYYVYIVKEEDTIDKILDKYQITKEDLELYNNIENIKPYDKIIIPTNGR